MVRQQNTEQQSSTDVTQAMKGRASSSYGSLQSRTINQGKPVNVNRIDASAVGMNKSGVSATTGILNQSNYMSNGNFSHIKNYNDGGQIQSSTFERSATLGSQINLNNTVVSVVSQNTSAERQGNRPISRENKVRVQAANRNSQQNTGEIQSQQELSSQKLIQ